MAAKWLVLCGIGILLIITIIQCQDLVSEKCRRPLKFDGDNLMSYLQCVKTYVNPRYGKRGSPNHKIDKYQYWTNEDYLPDYFYQN